MRITQLDLNAFKSFTGVVLATDAPRVLIGGLNGSGKTSIRESVKWVLTGRCQGTNGKGSGTDALAPETVSPAQVDVAVAVSGIGAVHRAWHNGESVFRVAGFTGPAQAQQTALIEKLKTDERFLEAVLDSAAFLDLHHAEAKALVLSLLNIRIRLSEADEHEYTLDELDALYKDAFEARKDKKRDLQRTTVGPKPVDREVPALEAIERQLAKLRGDLETATGALGRIVGAGSADRTRIVAITGQLAFLGPEITKLEGLGLPAQIEALEERLSIMEAEATTDQPIEPGVGTEGRVAFLKGRIEAIRLHKPSNGCVFGEDIPCETAKKHFSAHMQTLKTELDAIRGDPDAPKPTQNTLTVVRKQLEQVRLTAVQLEQAIGKKALLEGELAALRGKEPAGDPQPLQTEIDALKARITKGEGLLRDARAYWEAVKAYDTAVAIRTKLETEVAELEQTVEALGPNGLRVQALASALGAFEQAVNAFTGPFGWTVKFQVEPWGVVVNERPVETYSKSERFRIGVAIQLAVAALSGLSFAIVDEIDQLDGTNRRLLSQMLLSAPVDQIVMLSTREPTQALPVAPGIVAYRLDRVEGRSVVVERSASAAA